MLDQLRSLFGSNDVEEMSLRRWAASKTDRNNRHQHADAVDETINASLDELPELRRRCQHEVENNPILAGIVDTHVTDIVGKDGPSLQIVTDNDEFNTALESVWQDFWDAPTTDGELSGVECLRLDVRSLWTAGESFDQIVSDRVEGDVGLRINPIHPRRCVQPLMYRASSGDGTEVVHGVEVDVETGVRNAFFFEPYTAQLGSIKPSVRVESTDVLHVLDRLEHGQLRGVPLAAPCLRVAADLREYDLSVLDAARIAADFCVMLVPDPDHVDPEKKSLKGDIPFKRRVVRTVPSGYKPEMIKPEQPHTKYVEFRHERLRDFGRAIGMPLMTILLDSSGHNYSSARFDGQVYIRGISRLQGLFTRRKLQRLLKLVAKQAIAGGLVPALNGKLKATWTWPTPPHVDPLKEAAAWEKLLKLGVCSEYDVCGAMGKDYEKVLANIVRAANARKAAGLDDGETRELDEALSTLKREKKTDRSLHSFTMRCAV